ncbi:MAG: phosphoglycerate kinase [Candidatus Woesebacteria bacterium GW2011_GWB1_38_5]|uniref:Phosphoglycerate kinase n=4 Tax=Candidatus Woeseibacteriota TaxID=1752722 RepID=A0A0G0N6C4_9BACT|nr:MAG: phosphoglycerate kinase [Candidatus Woesebacteria bacterium GW2011_GWC1_38_13]KKQ72666.1 MAG: phosphoglycerate kinase [Candidatus Woesebacteria bacterium GW2011_GWB1_38_5]
MIKLPKLVELDISGKAVLLRLDLDVDEDYSRIEAAKETFDVLKSNNCRIIAIGHYGRPDGKVDEKYSLRRLAPVIEKISGMQTEFCEETVGEKAIRAVENLKQGCILLLENLRFNSGEEKNDPEFVRDLASLGEFYVNESFAVSHRSHASFIGLPSVLPHAAGMRLVKEVEVLSGILENPRRPVVAVISGVKKDKMDRIASILDKVDKVLVAGRLPIYYGDDNPDPEKIIMAKLVPDTEDITLHSIDKFKEEIAKANTIILAGVPGKYEDEGHRQGTMEVFNAIARSSAFKVAGGGDAEAAITLLGLNDKFDWISVGGGAALEFLANGTLPGIEALKV